MTQEKIGAVERLSQYVAFIRDSVRFEGKDTYLVFGAHGSEFFIELACEPLITRKILATIVVGFGGLNFDFIDTEDAIANNTEIFLQIPDSAHLIALLGLLERAFDNKTIILHPLDSNGDFLLGWNHAIKSVSERTF